MGDWRKMILERDGKRFCRKIVEKGKNDFVAERWKEDDTV